MAERSFTEGEGKSKDSARAWRIDAGVSRDWELENFLDDVFCPAEAFCRFCRAVGGNVSEAAAEDVGVIVAALTALSRHRLERFADCLQREAGPVLVEQAASHACAVNVYSVYFSRVAGANTVIGCLLYPDVEDINQARERVKYLFRKAKKKTK